MKKLLKKTLKLILPIVLGGFILYWVYRDFDFSRVGEVLRHGTNWWWMLFSLLFGVLAQVFRGWRWRQTLEPLGVYQALYGERGVWVRPASMWSEHVERDGYSGPRFTYLGE